jgi:DNA invertase Pin-like site-specific DNA recombinase
LVRKPHCRAQERGDGNDAAESADAMVRKKSVPAQSTPRRVGPSDRATSVAYLRVSSREQGRTGSGIEVQRQAISAFAISRGLPIIAEFVEVETARRDTIRNRPQLAAALALARRRQATLVVARLDRLSRSVLVTSQLLAANVDFVAVDAPNADRFFVQLAALMAEYESRLISERTREAIAAARARGVSFARTSYHFTAETRLKAAQRASASHIARAREAYADIAPIAVELRAEGVSWAAIARHLNRLGHTTRVGGPWGIHSTQSLVRREMVAAGERRSLVLREFHAVKGVRSPVHVDSVARRLQHNRFPASSEAPASKPDGRAIAYYRVSTKMQGGDGLGIAAQRAFVRNFCAQQQLRILEEYVEVETAWRTPLSHRPVLLEAISHAKAAGAALVISRLDRLARNVSVVSELIRSGVHFVIADAPWASEFTIMLLSAIAQEESRLISARMRGVRAAAKASGRVWHHVCNLPPGSQPAAVKLSADVRMARTRDRYRFIEPIAERLRGQGASYARIAKSLNDSGFLTQRNSRWTDVSVMNLLRRVGAAPVRVHRACSSLAN